MSGYKSIERGDDRAHTYFIRRGSDGAIKIGRSIDPKKRLKQLQTANDETLELIGVLTTDIESRLHSEFAHLSIAGEWFQASDVLLDFIAINREDKDNSDDGLRRVVKAFLRIYDSEQYRSYQEDFSFWLAVQKTPINCEAWGNARRSIEYVVDAMRNKIQPRTHPIRPKEPAEWDDDE
jgi:hypothetical protein